MGVDMRSKSVRPGTVISLMKLEPDALAEGVNGTYDVTLGVKGRRVGGFKWRSKNAFCFGNS